MAILPDDSGGRKTLSWPERRTRTAGHGTSAAARLSLVYRLDIPMDVETGKNVTASAGVRTKTSLSRASLARASLDARGRSMKSKTDAILIDERDNVAVALEVLPAGASVSVEVRGHAERITLLSEIPRGHKFALVDMETGATIVKYGQPIGQSTVPIARGAHVHVHNVISQPRGGDR